MNPSLVNRQFLNYSPSWEWYADGKNADPSTASSISNRVWLGGCRRSPVQLKQPSRSLISITAQPYIAGLPRDAIAPALFSRP